MTTWKTVETRGFMIRARPYETTRPDVENVVVAEVELFKIDHRDDDARPMMERRGSMSNNDCTPNMDEAEVSVAIGIKWDGCSNIEWKDLTHFCDVDVGAKLQEAFDAAFRLAHETISRPDWDPP